MAFESMKQQTRRGTLIKDDRKLLAVIMYKYGEYVTDPIECVVMPDDSDPDNSYSDYYIARDSVKYFHIYCEDQGFLTWLEVRIEMWSIAIHDIVTLLIDGLFDQFEEHGGHIECFYAIPRNALFSIRLSDSDPQLDGTISLSESPGRFAPPSGGRLDGQRFTDRGRKMVCSGLQPYHSLPDPVTPERLSFQASAKVYRNQPSPAALIQFESELEKSGRLSPRPSPRTDYRARREEPVLSGTHVPSMLPLY